MSKTMIDLNMSVFCAKNPFNALPELPPSSDVESKAVLKKCILARTALAELKQASEMLPNQFVLINTLPLLEAQASSEIENIVTTTDRLFQFANFGEHSADPATKEALRYRTALKDGVDSLSERPLSTSTAIKICSMIKHVNMEVRKVPGTSLTNQTTGETVYTPPSGEDVLCKKLKNWENFLHSQDDGLDPLVKMAIAHYQFEAIHPFTDGNGRTGRILNILYLIDQGLLNIPALYLSRYIIKNKNAYYSLLLNVTKEQDWESWVLYMLTAVEQTSRWTCNKISMILTLMSETQGHVRDHAEHIYSKELIDVIFTQPYCRISNVVDAGIAKRQTASQYLKKLSEIGVLEESQHGRDKVFINPRFMQLLSSEEDAYKPFR